MPGIFISYRREDGIAAAGRIYDRLVAEFGDRNVFMDLEKIGYGADFLRVIDEKLSASEVVLALIGPYWLLSRRGRRRFDTPEDVVRLEIASALKRGLRVIPVLLGGAKMPGRQDLPDELAEFVSRNAFEIDDRRFNQDAETLIESIRYPDQPPQKTARTKLEELRQRISFGKTALILSTIILFSTVAAAWVSLFDLFALETRMESVTLWLSDLIHEQAPSDQVILVTIDDGSVKAAGKPFDRSWRHEHARIIDTLSAAKARLIVFDVSFSEPSPFDDEFVQAVRRARERDAEVVVGYRGVSAGKPDLIASLRDSVSGWGLLCLGQRLGYANTAPLAVTDREDGAHRNRRPADLLTDQRVSLGMVAAFGRPTAIGLDDTRRELLVNSVTSGRIKNVKISHQELVKGNPSDCPALTKGDWVAALMIRLSSLQAWRKPPRRFAYEQLLSNPDAAALRALRGRIVLVGVTLKDKDVYRVMHGLSFEERHGIELHADLVSNLISGVHIHPLHWGGQLFMSILMVLLAAFCRLAYFDAKPAVRMRFCAVVLMVYLALAVGLLLGVNVLLNSVYHLAAFALTYWALGKFGRRTPWKS